MYPLAPNQHICCLCSHKDKHHQQLETKTSKASSLCVYICHAIVFPSHEVLGNNIVFQKLTIKHSWAFVITYIWCQADYNVKATTLYSLIIRLRRAYFLVPGVWCCFVLLIFVWELTWCAAERCAALERWKYGSTVSRFQPTFRVNLSSSFFLLGGFKVRGDR